jgi:hypothetical protein
VADDITIEDDKDFATVIGDEIRQAQNYDQTELSSKRAMATNYMRGDMPDLPARPNGSSQTSRDVADVVNWILPGIVRQFSEQMVAYEATQEGGEEGAEEASEYMNYSFFRENDGYKIIHHVTYDSLVQGNGLVGCYFDPPKIETKIFRDKLMEELAALVNDEGWKPLTQKSGKPRDVLMDDPATGEPVEVGVPTFTVKMSRETKRSKICDAVLKPENLLLNPGAVAIGERFTGYLHDDKTRSDLLEMAEQYGWDAGRIAQLPADTRAGANEVADARFRDRVVNDSSPLRSGDQIDLYECYIRADMDGDGIAELIQAWYAGNAGQGELLGWEEWEDDVPFSDVPCYPVPHRFDAEGIYDREGDIQRVKSVFIRNMIDNSYAVGLPMREVEEGSVLNPDILINPKFGGLIWKKRGTAPIVPHETPYIGDKLMMGLEYMDTLTAKRTGVSKTTMALDPEALQNQTAEASRNARDANYSQIELIARNQAELGWSVHFAKRYNLARKYLADEIRIPSKRGDKLPPDAMQQQGQTSKYRTITPAKWADDMAVTINVGLGTGSRDRDMAMLSVIKNGQMMMAQMLSANGMNAKAIEFIPKIRKTAVQEAEASGLKNPDSYYPDFTEEEVAAAIKQSQQPPGPPEAVLVEQERQKGAQALAQMNGQITLQTEQGKNQLAEQQARIQAEGEVVKNQAELQADLQTKEAERQNALIIAQQQGQIDLEKQSRELAFKTFELQTTTQLEREKMDNAVKVAAARPAPKPPGKGADAHG